MIPDLIFVSETTLSYSDQTFVRPRKCRLSSFLSGNCCLEYVFDENLPKIRYALRCIREWALLRGLKPKEVHYLKIKHDGTKKNLDFTKKGAPQVELIYRVNYISPHLPEQKTPILPPSSSPIACILKNHIQCYQCKKSVRKGGLGFLVGERSFCLRCGDGLNLR